MAVVVRLCGYDVVGACGVCVVCVHCRVCVVGPVCVSIGCDTWAYVSVLVVCLCGELIVDVMLVLLCGVH